MTVLDSPRSSNFLAMVSLTQDDLGGKILYCRLRVLHSYSLLSSCFAAAAMFPLADIRSRFDRMLIYHTPATPRDAFLNISPRGAHPRFIFF